MLRASRRSRVPRIPKPCPNLNPNTRPTMHPPLARDYSRVRQRGNERRGSVHLSGGGLGWVQPMCPQLVSCTHRHAAFWYAARPIHAQASLPCVINARKRLHIAPRCVAVCQHLARIARSSGCIAIPAHLYANLRGTSEVCKRIERRRERWGETHRNGCLLCDSGVPVGKFDRLVSRLPPCPAADGKRRHTNVLADIAAAIAAAPDDTPRRDLQTGRR